MESEQTFKSLEAPSIASTEAKELRLSELYLRQNAILKDRGLIELAWTHSAKELRRQADKDNYKLTGSWIMPQFVISLHFADKLSSGRVVGKPLVFGFVAEGTNYDTSKIPLDLWLRTEDKLLIANPTESAFRGFVPLLLEMALEEHRIKSE